MRTCEDYIDAKTAWKILKELEKLHHLLLQKYHYEFIELKHKEETNVEFAENLPF